MTHLVILMICFLFHVDSTSSLRASTVRELTGLYSKNKYYVSSSTAAGFVFPNVSEACQNAIRGLPSNPEFAKYIDATGRPNSGVLTGNLVWLGSYATCKAIPDAHYCLLPDITILIKNGNKSTKIPYIEWGLCLPAACSDDDIGFGFVDIAEILSTYLPAQFKGIVQAKINGVACAHPSKWTTGPIITLVVCIIIAWLCLVGTLVDMCVVQESWKFWVRSEVEYGRVPQSDESGLLANGFSNHSDGEAAPLLSAHRHGDSLNGSSVHIHQPNKKERGFLVNLLVCFSIIRNTSKIMDCSVPASAITSLNGVRVLSMWWVILGHTYLWLLVYRTINDLGLGVNIIHRFSFQAVNNAFFSVDSFFLLSGLLVGYLSFRRMDKNCGRLPLFQFYFHRFWRLTPSYMFVILFYANLYAFLGEGPLWYGSQLRTTCDSYWWTNLLYINNFHPFSLLKECLGWSWYLANDMQFYVISPILLYITFRFQWRGLLVSVGGLLGLSLLITAVIIGVYNTDVLEAGQIVTGFKKDPDRGSYSDLVYIKPYCRIAPYLVGIALGYLIHVEKVAPSKSPLHKVPRQVVCLVGWFLAIGLGVTTVYGVYTYYKAGGRPFNTAENIIYGTFSRFVWGLALAWVIYACNKGYGSLVNKILSASYWIPLSRLTYSAYLVHPLVVGSYFGSFKHTIEYSDKNFAFYFVSVVVMSYASAFVLAVCVEFPTMRLEDVLFFKVKKSRT